MKQKKTPKYLRMKKSKKYGNKQILNYSFFHSYTLTKQKTINSWKTFLTFSDFGHL